AQQCGDHRPAAAACGNDVHRDCYGDAPRPALVADVEVHDGEVTRVHPERSGTTPRVARTPRGATLPAARRDKPAACPYGGAVRLRGDRPEWSLRNPGRQPDAGGPGWASLQDFFASGELSGRAARPRQ